MIRFVLLAFLILVSAVAADTAKSNILFIVTDDVSCDSVGVHCCNEVKYDPDALTNLIDHPAHAAQVTALENALEDWMVKTKILCWRCSGVAMTPLIARHGCRRRSKAQPAARNEKPGGAG